MAVPICELTKKARAEFLPVPALAMSIELSSREAARMRYCFAPLIFVNAYFRKWSDAQNFRKKLYVIENWLDELPSFLSIILSDEA